MNSGSFRNSQAVMCARSLLYPALISASASVHFGLFTKAASTKRLFFVKAIYLPVISLLRVMGCGIEKFMGCRVSGGRPSYKLRISDVEGIPGIRTVLRDVCSILP